MPPTANKALVRRFYEDAWSQDRLEVIDDVFAEDWNHRDDLGLMEQIGAPIYAGAQPDA